MSACLAIPMYVRCGCDLDGKLNGKRCPHCDGWGVLLAELPPKPEPQRELDFTSSDSSQEK